MTVNVGKGMPKAALRIMMRDKIKDIVLCRDKIIKHVRINGYSIRVTVDEGLGWSMYYLKRYDSAETNFIKRIAQKNWICFDIGANVGYYSLLFASLAKDGTVHSFEPIPFYYHLLNTSISLNNFTNITVNRCALGDRAGISDFAVSKRMGDSSFVHIGTSSLQSIIKVQVRTLDDYVKENKIERIDMLKLDVEGAEKLVLNGSLNTLSKKELQPAILFVELYDDHCSRYGTSVDETVRFLQSCGYEAFIIPKLRLVPFVKEHYNKWYNVFFIKKGEQLQKLQNNIKLC